jgi:hypothetical protein
MVGIELPLGSRSFKLDHAPIGDPRL